MAQKATFTFSAAAAPYLAQDASREKRLLGAAGPPELLPLERLQLLVCLGNDPDAEVRDRATATLRALDSRWIEEVLRDPALHWRLLDVLVKFHAGRSELVPLFLAHPLLSPQAAAFLAAKGAPASVPAPRAAEPAAEPDAPVSPSDLNAAEGEGEAEEESDEIDEEEYQSKYQMAQSMGVAEKIKAALTGDKEWRTLLIKDSNKLVSGAVIKNPRLTENEVLTIAKSAVQNDEVMRVICANKEWVKNYQIRKALVENHKTPLPNALRYVATLTEKDLAMLAKSKNVSTVIATQARRILMSKSQK
ncbi:hypothetical protein [Geomesophilobacter sediminis]|uniref:Uncharacterized protein n=1 Tax=Geomesophilobacter sediminis TaxID=2798584 RepID=A0A8J7M2I1_9BACT|nr:hypothetical protein [Geomesophilobacter sediminis]MBJ6727549.1 hypothetical protein [Geomesophilobacter sediminis]